MLPVMVWSLQFEALQQRIDASGIQTKGWITHGPIAQLPSKGIGAVAEMFRNGGMEFGVFPNRCGDSGTHLPIAPHASTSTSRTSTSHTSTNCKALSPLRHKLECARIACRMVSRRT